MTNNTKMLRDSLGDVIPQMLNENGTYTALANGDTSGIDFSKYKMLRDAFGDSLPNQYFDVTLMKFVSDTSGGGGGGEKGEKGDDGKSAYQIALEQGFVGTESQWITSLKGAKGDTGATGQAGSNATVTNTSVVSALGYTPANITTTNAHINNTNIHLTYAQKQALLTAMDRSTVRMTSNAEAQKTPPYYYADGIGISWEYWSCTKLGIPVSDSSLYGTVCTIVPYDIGIEKLIQVAYVVEGMFTRHSIGDDESTATWSHWVRLLTQIDLDSVNEQMLQLTHRMDALEDGI